MPVVLRLGTLVHCADPPAVPQADPDGSAPRSGPCGLLPTQVSDGSNKDCHAPPVNAISPNASVDETSSRRNSTARPLKRLLQRHRNEGSERLVAPDAHMLMPMWTSQCLSPSTTSTGAIHQLVDATAEQLLRGQLATFEEYVSLGGMPSSWALTRFGCSLPATAAADTESGISGETQKERKARLAKEAKKKKKEEKEKRRKKKKHQKRLRSHSGGSAASSSSSSVASAGSKSHTRHRHRDSATNVWCLCCRDAHGAFRYCGQCTITPRRRRASAAAAAAAAAMRQTPSSKRAAVPHLPPSVSAATVAPSPTSTPPPEPPPDSSAGEEDEAETALPVSQDDVFLTQVPFIIDACVTAHTALNAANAASAAAAAQSASDTRSDDEEDEDAPFSANAIQMPSSSTTADTRRAQPCDEVGSPGILARSLLAGLSQSNDETDSHGLSRYTSDVIDGASPARSECTAQTAGMSLPGVSVSIHTGAATLPAVVSDDHPLAHKHHRHHTAHSHPRRTRPLKFAILFGLVLPLPVLLMLNPYVAAPDLPTSPTGRRHGLWRRHEDRNAIPPKSPTTPTSPRRRRGGEAKPKRRVERTSFTLAEAVEVPSVLSHEPVVPRRIMMPAGAAASVGVMMPPPLQQPLRTPSPPTTLPDGTPVTAPLSQASASLSATATARQAPGPTSHDNNNNNNRLSPSNSGGGEWEPVRAQISGERVPRWAALRDQLAPLTADMPGPPLLLPTNNADQHKALVATGPSSIRQVEAAEAAVPWLSEESSARFAQAQTKATQRLSQAHQRYSRAVAQLQSLAMPMSAGPETMALTVQGDETLLSLESGLRRAWSDWLDMWQMPSSSPSSSPAKTPARVSPHSPSLAVLPDSDDTTLRDLVRRQIELTAELRECEAAAQDAERLRTLIHVYEQDLAASRERQVALQSAMHAQHGCS